MAPKLSEGTTVRVTLVFPSKDRNKAARLLVKVCGNNLPFCENADDAQLERIRFAALKESNGRLDRLERAIALAKSDWRDLLRRAGFVDDLDAHHHWLAEEVKAAVESGAIISVHRQPTRRECLFIAYFLLFGGLLGLIGLGLVPFRTDWQWECAVFMGVSTALFVLGGIWFLRRARRLT